MASIGIVYWTALVVVQYGGLPLPLGIGVMLLLAAALGLFTALFGALLGLWLRRVGEAAFLLAPLAWVATEILRTHTLFDFAWCLLGYTQQPNLPFIQIASVTAVYGVSFLVVLVNGVLAYVAREPVPRRRTAAAFGCMALLGAVGGWGAWQMRMPVPESGRVRVGLIQAAIEQDDKWDPEHLADNVSRHLRLTHEAVEGGARLVVWPESAVPGYYDLDYGLADVLRTVARQGRIWLLFGNDDREPVPDGPARVFVGAKMVSPGGELALRYHKVHLVPFGEYVPLQPLLTLGGRFAAKLVRQVADFTPGHAFPTGTVDGHPVGAFICYEAIFPDLVRRFPGQEMLVNITNDGWYGRTSAPYQHLAQAAFRAVENRKYLVRAANTGFTAVVDPRGRILQKTELFDQVALVREVPFVPGETFYARHGDVFAWTCLILALGLTLGLSRGGRGQHSEVGLARPVLGGMPS